MTTLAQQRVSQEAAATACEKDLSLPTSSAKDFGHATSRSSAPALGPLVWAPGASLLVAKRSGSASHECCWCSSPSEPHEKGFAWPGLHSAAKWLPWSASASSLCLHGFLVIQTV